MNLMRIGAPDAEKPVARVDDTHSIDGLGTHRLRVVGPR